MAIVGATGAVGIEMIKTLEKRKFPLKELVLLASARSVGRKLTFRGKKIAVKELTKDSFAGIDIALFSAGGGISKEFAPIAAAAGCVFALVRTRSGSLLWPMLCHTAINLPPHIIAVMQ